MAHLSRDNRKRVLKKTIYKILIILLVVFLFATNRFNFLDKPIQAVSTPLWKIKNYILSESQEFISFLKSKQTLIDENNVLREKANYLSYKLVNYNLIEEENLAIKKILDKKNDSRIILTNILLKPSLSFYDNLFVDAGLDSGVKIGDRALVGQSIIVGEVEEVYPHSSKIKLFSFYGDILEVAIGFNKILAEAKGLGGLMFEIKLPQDVKINKGDFVTLPDEDIKILGVIEDIEIKPEDPFQTILFRSPVNIFELRWIELLQKE
ncbi:MAG: rod shape-determining protein MreC [Patescibacteria group bacterium]